MRRTLPALFLPRSPLIVVLGQVRFAPILVMSEFVPRIQEALRRAGFPGYRASELEEVTWNFTPGAQPNINTRKQPRWEFQDAENTWRLLLTNEALTLATSAYQTYEDPFERRFRAALEAVHASAELQVITRLGLRYVDRIVPDAGLGFGDYLHDRLLGIPPADLGLLNAQPYLQIKGATAIGFMLIRCVYTGGDQMLPPDLIDLDLRLSPAPSPAAEAAILDFDHYSTDSSPFDVEDTMSKLGALHDTLDIAFRQMVTRKALDRWRTGSEIPKRNAKARKARS